MDPTQLGPVELVTRFVRNLANGDVEASLQLAHPDLVFSEAKSLPFGGDRLGADGLNSLLAAIARDYRIRLGEPVVAQAGECVVVRVSGTIQSRATGNSMPLDALDVYTVRDGRIQRVDVYYKDTTAVTALLDESPAVTAQRATA